MPDSPVLQIQLRKDIPHFAGSATFFMEMDLDPTNYSGLHGF
jgi:hypothetical protein